MFTSIGIKVSVTFLSNLNLDISNPDEFMHWILEFMNIGLLMNSCFMNLLKIINLDLRLQFVFVVLF